MTTDMMMSEQKSLEDTIAKGFYRIHTKSGGTKLTNGKEYRNFKDFAKENQHFWGKIFYLLDTQPNEEPWPVIKLTVDFTKPYGKISAEPLLNIAPPMPIEAENNNKDTAILWAHLENLCGRVEQDVKEWVKDWLADIFQNPMNKPPTSLTFRSEQGTGKSIFWEKLMGILLGERHLQTAQNIIGAQFNNDARSRLLINLNEGSFTKNNIDLIKSFISESTFHFEGKGKDREELPNHARLVITTNAALVTDDEDSRRFCMLNPIKDDYDTPDYFKNLSAAIVDEQTVKKFLYELENRPITHNLHIIPKTEEYKSQQELAREYYDIWLNEVLNDGKYKTKEGVDLWIEFDENHKICKSETAMEDYSKRFKKEPKLFQKIKDRTQKLGYTVNNPTKRDKATEGTIRVWEFTKIAGGNKRKTNWIEYLRNTFGNADQLKRDKYPAIPPDLKEDTNITPISPNTPFSAYTKAELPPEYKNKDNGFGD